MRLRLLLFSVISAASCTEVHAANFVMMDAGDVPHINQAQNFADLMNPRGTDLSINNNQLMYMQLPIAGGNALGALHAQIDPNRVRAADQRPAQFFVDQNSQLGGYRQFRDNESQSRHRLPCC
jgi:hypothetical protein